MPPTAKLWALRLLAGVLLLVGAIPAQAYVLESSAWTLGSSAASPHVVTMQLELQTTGPANKTLIDGKTNWDQVALEAFSIWNQYLVGMQFNGVAGSTAAVSSSGNGINTVSWEANTFNSPDEAWPDGVVGLTYRYWQGGNATILPTQETDVIFNSNTPWDSYRGPQLPGALDLRRVALHEFGHVLGLNHPNDAGQVVAAIMNSVVNGIDTLQPDDIAGGQYLYNFGPAITTQPSSQTAPSGGTVTFTVATADNPAATFQWTFNGTAISGATSVTLTLSNLSASNQGNYQVVVTDRAASINSAIATLVVNAVATAPLFTAQPLSVTVPAGATAALDAQATGATSYQWKLNGTNVAGATTARLMIANVGSATTGSYTVVATNAAGSVTSAAATLSTTTTTNPGRLINLSVLTTAGSTKLLTVGFNTGGSGTSGQQALLIRGIGPALSAFGLSTAPQADPTLTVLSQNGGASVASNDNWGSTTTNATAVTNADNATGAFPITNTSSLDAALVQTISAGGYSVQVSSNNTTVGNVLAEVYDDTTSGTYTLATPRLINLSCISPVAAGGSLTAGFTIGGSTSRTVLIRAVGPALGALGVPSTMPDPQLVLNASSGGVVGTNAAWGGDPQIVTASANVGAFSLGSATSLDSVLLITLAPGGYSAIASSVSGAAGTCLIEVYEVP